VRCASRLDGSRFLPPPPLRGRVGWGVGSASADQRRSVHLCWQEKLIRPPPPRPPPFNARACRPAGGGGRKKARRVTEGSLSRDGNALRPPAPPRRPASRGRLSRAAALAVEDRGAADGGARSFVSDHGGRDLCSRRREREREVDSGAGRGRTSAGAPWP